MNSVRYLGFLTLPPDVNMAIDIMLLNAAIEHYGNAYLRFFLFDRKCMSIGRNQMYGSLPPDMQNNGLETVKRPTGGGSVVHDKDLCYCLVLPERYLGDHKSLIDSYTMITEGFRKGFSTSGIDTDYGSDKAVDYKKEAVCFARSLPYELTLNGKKIIGSAQRRTKGVLLQQGSIMFNKINYERLITALLEGLKTSLGITYVNDPITEEELKALPQKCI